MCYSNPPKIGASWQQGGRIDILRWLTVLQKACIATVDFTTLPADFMTEGFANGLPIHCDFALIIRSDSSVFLSVDFGQTWILLFDPDVALGIAVGTQVWFAGAVAGLPSGWLIADGSAVNRVTYADLFAKLGTTYGVGDGVNTFNLPDMRGRAVAGVNDSGLPNGADGALSTRNRAATGGAETHTLIEAELAAHFHSFKTGGSANYATGGTTISIARATNGNSSSTGGGGSHNNLQPSIALMMLIKT